MSLATLDPTTQLRPRTPAAAVLRVLWSGSPVVHVSVADVSAEPSLLAVVTSTVVAHAAIPTAVAVSAPDPTAPGDVLDALATVERTGNPNDPHGQTIRVQYSAQRQVVRVMAEDAWRRQGRDGLALGPPPPELETMARTPAGLALLARAHGLDLWPSGLVCDQVAVRVIEGARQGESLSLLAELVGEQVGRSGTWSGARRTNRRFTHEMVQAVLRSAGLVRRAA